MTPDATLAADRPKFFIIPGGGHKRRLFRQQPHPDNGPADGSPGVPQCENCGSQHYRDVPIHGGKSTRRDCAGCGKFIEFSVWYGMIQAPATSRDATAKESAK
jgi:hypothetical protein